MRVETCYFAPETGWSVHPLPQLDSEHTLVLIFSAPEYLDKPEPLESLARAYPRSQIVGCSTAGEIHAGTIRDHSVTVAVIRFDHARVVTASAPITSVEESFDAGRRIAEALGQLDLRAVFVLSDGSIVNGSELVRGFNAVLPHSTIVTGGLAGDGDRFQRTWIVSDGKPQTAMVAAIGFCGDQLTVGHGSAGGWEAFGLERVVTRSRGNVLHELDGRPALQLYKTYLGDMAAGLPSTALLFPLALRQNAEDTTPVVRTVLGVDEASQSMTFAGDIPQGYRARLMKASFDRLIGGASQAAAMARSAGTPGTPVGDMLSITVSCVGRRLVMGQQTDQELEAMLRILPRGIHQIGFYSYGEISPAGGYCDLHNQTMSVTTFYETKS